MSVERSGYVLSERVRRVWERLSRSSCISAVALVLSGGVDAAVDERGRRDFVDMLLLILQHCPNLQADSRIPKLLHLSRFQARGKPRHPDLLAGIEIEDCERFEIVGAAGRGVRCCPDGE